MSGTLSVEYWFLYAYIAMLLALPFFRKIALNLSSADFLLLLILRLFSYSLYSIGKFVASNLGLDIVTLQENLYFSFSFDVVLFYPLVGFYLENRLKISSVKRKHMLLCFLSMLFCVIGTTLIVYEQGKQKEFTQDYIQLFDYILAICVFVLVKAFCEKMKKCKRIVWIENVFVRISGLTFGIYLMEPRFRGFFSNRIYELLGGELNLMIHSVLWCMIAMLFCGFITYLLKKDADYKKYIIIKMNLDICWKEVLRNI